MRVALFGGTFDPVHVGHLLMAEAAREQARLDRVVFLPAGCPLHKNAPLAPAADRLAMLRLAVRSHPFFSISDWDARQARPVYTVEALAHFKEVYPRATLYFILGTDALRDLPGWRQGVALLGRARFLAVERPEVPWTSLPAQLRRRASRIDAPLSGLASRVIRERIRRRKSVRYQVSEAVAGYIARRGLYRSAA